MIDDATEVILEDDDRVVEVDGREEDAAEELRARDRGLGGGLAGGAQHAAAEGHLLALALGIVSQVGAEDEKAADKGEGLGDKLDVGELRVEHWLRDRPPDERLCRDVGLEEREEAQRAERLGKQANAQSDGGDGKDELGRRSRERFEVALLAHLQGVLGEVRRRADGVIQEGRNQDQPDDKLETRPPNFHEQLDAHALVERLEATEEKALAHS